MLMMVIIFKCSYFGRKTCSYFHDRIFVSIAAKVVWLISPGTLLGTLEIGVIP